MADLDPKVLLALGAILATPTKAGPGERADDTWRDLVGEPLSDEEEAAVKGHVDRLRGVFAKAQNDQNAFDAEVLNLKIFPPG
jgi:hypothetical protein